jgi:hypothetical protein
MRGAKGRQVRRRRQRMNLSREKQWKEVGGEEKNMKQGRHARG